MEYVFTSFTTFDREKLLSGTDKSDEARFNRLGVCFKPGHYNGDVYRYGEFKRISQTELEHQARLEKKTKLFEEAEEARKRSKTAHTEIESLDKHHAELKAAFERNIARLQEEKNRSIEKMNRMETLAADKLRMAQELI